jgi:hypothetical protein
MYLAGAIEKAKDNGIGIRKRIMTELDDLDIQLINPCDFEYNQEKFPTMWHYQREVAHDFEDCLKHSGNIADGDCEHVKLSDFVLVLIDENCGPGTASEVTLAKWLHIPVLGLFVNPKNWRECHPWILSRVKRFFYDTDELKTFLTTFYGVEKKDG